MLDHKIRLKVPTSFSAELESMAEELSKEPPPDLDEARRRDLTAMRAFAVDDVETKEVRKRCERG